MIFAVSLALVSGCQSNIPEEIRLSMEGAPGLAQVRQQPQDYISQSVRWGGLILDTENRQNTSRLTIMALPLNDSGKPSIYDNSPGRFIAVVDKFLEPLEFGRDRQITVIGSIVGTETLKVGEFPYIYPVVQVEQHHLWPKAIPTNYHNYPGYWRHDPWFYPAYSPWYYPYRPYPIRLVPQHPKLVK